MDILKVLEEQRLNLTAQLNDIAVKRAELDDQVAKINAELKAINAYENAKTGKKPATKATRTRETGMKQQILTLLQGRQLKRAEIIEALGYKDDKKKQGSVSNTLVALKKDGKINATDGVYTLT